MFGETTTLLSAQTANPTSGAILGQTIFDTNNSESSCKCSSDFLQQRLIESQYGKDTQVFDSYFVPNVMPPRCVACNKLVAEHPSAGAGGAAFVAIPGAITNQSPVPVDGLTKTDNVDTYKKTPLRVFYYIAVFELFIGCVMFVAFGVNGLLSRAPVTMTGPCIVSFIGLVFLFVPLNFHIEFDKVAKVVRVSQWRFPFCCSDKREIPFSAITGQAITLENPTMYISGSSSNGYLPQQKVVLNYTTTSSHSGMGMPPTTEKIDIGMANILTSQGVALGWMQYLRELGMNVAAPPS